MKRRILGLACAMTMVVGMSMTAFAAGSSNAPAVAQAVTKNEAVITADSNAMGQVITGNTLEFFKTDTQISGVEGLKVLVVPTEAAAKIAEHAKELAGENAFIATMVDLEVPAGTGTATFTLNCSNVWSGQSVTILHLKSDGTVERITPGSVEDNRVTFTMSSYSPIAVVIDTAASTVKSPKTGDVSALAAAATLFCGTGALFFRRKSRV